MNPTKSLPVNNKNTSLQNDQNKKNQEDKYSMPKDTSQHYSQDQFEESKTAGAQNPSQPITPKESNTLSVQQKINMTSPQAKNQFESSASMLSSAGMRLEQRLNNVIESKKDLD